jgi:EpsI family protein
MIQNWRFIVVYLLMAAAGMYVNFHKDIMVPTNTPLREFPSLNGEWRQVSRSEFSDEILNVLKPTDYLAAQYANYQGDKVNLYIGYHGGGKGGGEIHSPKNCLPGSGWFRLSEQVVPLKVDGKDLSVVQAVYKKGRDTELFVYWFRAKDDEAITSEVGLKLAQIRSSITSRRRDATFIRISAPAGVDENNKQAAVYKFIRDFYPLFQKFLPS